MVPITNSLAFMFTVLGEWFATKKVISRGQRCVSILVVTTCILTALLDTWIGMALVLGGIGLCVHSKNT